MRTLGIDVDVTLSDKPDAPPPAAGAWLGPEGLFDYQDTDSDDDLIRVLKIMGVNTDIG